MSNRALFVTTVPLTLQAFLLPLADELRTQGWSIDALTGDPSDLVMLGDEKTLQSHFDIIHRIGWSRSLKSLVRLPKYSRQIRKLVRESGYNVVHVHTPIAAFVTRYALKQLSPAKRPRVIYTVHGFHFQDCDHPSFLERFYKTAERYSIHATDDLVVMNDRDMKAGQELVALTHNCERPTVLHRIDGTGLDFSLYRRQDDSESHNNRQLLRKQHGIPEDAFLVGMIAEMNENKRHYVVIECAQRLAERDRSVIQQPIHFLFIGSGPLQDKLKQMVDSFGLSNTIHFTDQISHQEVRALITICDLGLLVSKREGLPRSLMEFVASGVPVIGSNIRGITDIAQDPDALAEPIPDALAQLIEYYMNNPELLPALAERQYTHAVEFYDKSVVLEKYLELYS